MPSDVEPPVKRRFTDEPVVEEHASAGGIGLDARVDHRSLEAILIKVGLADLDCDGVTFTRPSRQRELEHVVARRHGELMRARARLRVAMRVADRDLHVLGDCGDGDPGRQGAQHAQSILDDLAAWIGHVGLHQIA